MRTLIDEDEYSMLVGHITGQMLASNRLRDKVDRDPWPIICEESRRQLRREFWILLSFGMTDELESDLLAGLAESMLLLLQGHGELTKMFKVYHQLLREQHRFRPMDQLIIRWHGTWQASQLLRSGPSSIYQTALG